jgi:hypothetical protein
MNGSPDILRRVLGPTGSDPGCDHTGELLDQFVEAELAGRPAREMFPDVASHQDGCPDCREDHLALRDLAGGLDIGEEADP